MSSSMEPSSPTLTPPGTAAYSVLSDANLFRAIAGYQAGWTLPLLLRWRELKPSNRNDFMDMLLREGDLATLKLAVHSLWYENNSPCCFQVSNLAPAIASGDPAVLQWALTFLSDDVGTHSCPLDLWIQALTTFSGHCSILQLLHEHRPLPVDRKVHIQSLFITAIMPTAPLVQWLVASIGHESLPEVLLKRAALRGDLELVKFLVMVPGQRLQPSAYCLIYDRSRLKYEHGQNGEGDQLREVLEYLLVHCHDAHDPALEHNVAAHGDIAMLKIIQQARGLQHLSPTMVTAAAANGHIDTLRVIVDANSTLITTDAVDKAACNGHLDVLEFLYSKGTARCLATGVNGAAAKGRLDILQLIHEHDTSSFSEFTMNCAAKKNHWDVVDFVVARHPEFSTVAIATTAIQVSRLDLDLVQRYCQRMTSSQIQRLVHAASLSGKTNIAQYLQQLEPSIM